MTRAKRQLFGGAIQAFLPDTAVDASVVRHVPDNQEVFVHTSSDQSLIIEILEQANVDDSNAIKYHFDALAEANDASNANDHITDKIEQIPNNSLTVQRVSTAYYLFGRQKISKYNEQAKNLVSLHLCLLRLNELNTDILISFNDPLFVNEDSSSHATIDSASSNNRWTFTDFQNFYQSFEIVDFGLFTPQQQDIEMN